LEGWRRVEFFKETKTICFKLNMELALAFPGPESL
jgi:hypothetical protein